jgi:hypothetical protein
MMMHTPYNHMEIMAYLLKQRLVIHVGHGEGAVVEAAELRGGGQLEVGEQLAALAELVEDVKAPLVGRLRGYTIVNICQSEAVLTCSGR